MWDEGRGGSDSVGREWRKRLSEVKRSAFAGQADNFSINLGQRQRDSEFLASFLYPR